MAIGLYIGRTSPADNIDPCYEAVRTFLQNFTAQFNSLNCLELTGVHLGTPEGQAAFTEGGKINDCTNFVGEAARMVVEIMDEPQKQH